MRKIGEKVALIAQICVAVIFVIIALLYALSIVPQATLENDTVVLVVMLVLAVAFVGTSSYLVYMSFSELQNLKRILLYADSKSATTTNIKVVNKIARSCADKIEGVHVKKTKIRADEKKGYVATFVVEVSAPSATPALEQLRCLVEDSFKETLGLVFNTITFEIAKLKSQPITDVNKAKKKAQAIADGADVVQDIYNNPTGEQSTDIVLPLPTDEPVEVATEEPVATPVEQSSEGPTVETTTEVETQTDEPVEIVDESNGDDVAVETPIEEPVE